MRIAIPLGLALLLPIMPAQALDLQDLEAAKEKAAEIREVTDILTGEDLELRKTVFDMVMKGNDPDLRSIAMEEALTGDDDQLKTKAFRQLFQSRDRLLIDVIMPDDPNPTQVWLHQAWNGLTLYKIEFEKETDAITTEFVTTELRDDRNEASGQILRGGMKIRLVPVYRKQVCILKTGKVITTTIEGTLDCSLTKDLMNLIEDSVPAATLPITITLS